MEITLGNAILAENYRRRGYDVPEDLFLRRLVTVAPLNERESEMMQQLQEAKEEILELRRKLYEAEQQIRRLKNQQPEITTVTPRESLPTGKMDMPMIEAPKGTIDL